MKSFYTTSLMFIMSISTLLSQVQVSFVHPAAGETICAERDFYFKYCLLSNISSDWYSFYVSYDDQPMEKVGYVTIFDTQGENQCDLSPNYPFQPRSDKNFVKFLIVNTNPIPPIVVAQTPNIPIKKDCPTCDLKDPIQLTGCNIGEPNRILVVTSSIVLAMGYGCILRSTDSGKNFQTVISSIPYQRPSIDLVANPDKSIIYAVTEDWALKSTDYGLTWLDCPGVSPFDACTFNHCATGSGSNILTTCPHNNPTQTNIQYSTDAFQTIRDGQSISNSFVKDIAFMPGTNQTFFACGWYQPNPQSNYIARIWKTTNSGASWIEILSEAGVGDFCALAFSPFGSNGVAFARNQSSISGKFTTDYGQTWQNIQTIPSNEIDVKDVFFFDNFDALAINRRGDLFSTSDGGKNWIICTTLKNSTFNDPSISGFKCQNNLKNIYVVGDNMSLFSQVNCSEPKLIHINSPFGGEVLGSGSIQEIRWQSFKTEKIRIEYKDPADTKWEFIVNNLSASSGSYKWTVATFAYDKTIQIKITDMSDENNYAISNTFTIIPCQSIHAGLGLAIKVPGYSEKFYKSPVTDGSGIMNWQASDIYTQWEKRNTAPRELFENAEFKPENVIFEGGTINISASYEGRDLVWVGCRNEYGGQLTLGNPNFNPDDEYTYNVIMKPATTTGVVSAFFIHFIDGETDNPMVCQNNHEIDIEVLRLKDNTLRCYFTTWTRAVKPYTGWGDNPCEPDNDKWNDRQQETNFIYLDEDYVNKFHKYSFTWKKNSVDFFIDDQFIISHNSVVPTHSAPIKINTWPATNWAWSNAENPPNYSGTCEIKKVWITETSPLQNFIICDAPQELSQNIRDFTVQNLEDTRSFLIKNKINPINEQIKILYEKKDDIGTVFEYDVHLNGSNELPTDNPKCKGTGLTINYLTTTLITNQDILFVPVHEYFHKILLQNNQYNFKGQNYKDQEGLVNFCVFLSTGTDCPFKKGFEKDFLNEIKKGNDTYLTIFKFYDPREFFPQTDQSPFYQFWNPISEGLAARERKGIMYYALQYDFWKYYFGTNHDPLKPDINKYIKLLNNLNNPIDQDIQEWKEVYLPKVPVIQYPTNGIKDVDSKVTFIWKNVKNAIKYHLQVSEGPFSLISYKEKNKNKILNSSLIVDTTIIDTNFTIENLKANQTYYWTVKSIKGDSLSSFWSDSLNFTTKEKFTSVEENINYQIYQLAVSPNPFSNNTDIQFIIEKPLRISLSISDNIGIEVKSLINNVYTEQGLNKITFDASDLSSGVYFCTLKAGCHIETVKFVIVK